MVSEVPKLPALLMHFRGREGSFARYFVDALAGSAGLGLVGTFLGFLVGVQLARGLGIENYGVYGFCMALASLGATFASGGVQLLATRETAALLATEKREELWDFLQWAFKVVLRLSVASGATAAIVVWTQTGSTITAIFVALTVLTLALLALVGATIRGSGAIVAGQSLNAVLKPLFVAVALALWAITLGNILPEHALGIGVAAALLAIAIGLVSIRHLFHRQNTSVASTDPTPWRRAATTMGVTTIISAADAALPLLLLGVFVASVEVGAYRVAASALVLVAMPVTIVSIMAPAMAARLYALADRRRLALLASAASIFTVVSTSLLAAILFFYGEQLISVIFGAEYRAAWTPLMLLSGGAVLSSLGGISIALLHVSGHEKLVTLAFGLALLLAASLAPWMVPTYGANGAAIIAVASIALRELILIAACLIKLRIDPSILSAPFRIMGHLFPVSRR